MPVPISRPTGTKPWGMLGYLKDLISPPGYVARGPFGSRSAAAATRPASTGVVGPTQDVYEQPGVGFFDRRSGRFLGGGSGSTSTSTPIVTGTRDGVTPDRTQSDLYKQYALNPQGQFDRYFGGSQMDQYFGAASRGAGAPKTLEEMMALASQMKASTNVPLADYYRAQSAAGRGNMPEIVEGLTQGLDTQKANAMKQWAQANPMLAMREFNKRFPSGQPTMGSGEPSVAQSLQGTQYQGVGGQGFDTSALTGDPITKAFTLPGGAMTQGQAVSAPYQQANYLAAEKTNPQNALSQMPIGDRTKEFLSAVGVLPDMKGKGAFGS